MTSYKLKKEAYDRYILHKNPSDKALHDEYVNDGKAIRLAFIRLINDKYDKELKDGNRHK
jgi:hypothetical protein